MGNKLYVGNLPYSYRDSDMEQAFAQFGTVTSAKVMMERDTGRSKGFGFVEMSTKPVRWSPAAVAAAASVVAAAAVVAASAAAAAAVVVAATAAVAAVAVAKAAVAAATAAAAVAAIATEIARTRACGPGRQRACGPFFHGRAGLPPPQ
ncbi:MAG: putative glycine-rich binding protein [Ramlibacter sp.]|nr:putative glycine-rich binding protein [Ramlibacter sp.]